MNICDSKTNIAFARDAVKKQLLLPDRMITELSKTQLCNLLLLCKNDRLPAAPFMLPPKKVGQYMIAVYSNSPLSPNDFAALLAKNPASTITKIRRLATKMNIVYNKDQSINDVKDMIFDKLVKLGIPEPIRVHVSESKEAMLNGNFGNNARNASNSNAVNNIAMNESRLNNSARNGSNSNAGNNNSARNGSNSNSGNNSARNGSNSNSNTGNNSSSRTNVSKNSGNVRRSGNVGPGQVVASNNRNRGPMVIQRNRKPTYITSGSSEPSYAVMGGGQGGRITSLNMGSRNRNRYAYSQRGGLPSFYNERSKLNQYYKNKMRNAAMKAEYNKKLKEINNREKKTKEVVASKHTQLKKLLNNGQYGGVFGFGSTNLSNVQKTKIAFLLGIKNLSGLNNAANMNKINKYYDSVIRSRIYKKLSNLSTNTYAGLVGKNLTGLRNMALKSSPQTEKNKEIVRLINLLGTKNNVNTLVQSGIPSKEANQIMKEVPVGPTGEAVQVHAVKPIATPSNAPVVNNIARNALIKRLKNMITNYKKNSEYNALTQNQKNLINKAIAELPVPVNVTNNLKALENQWETAIKNRTNKNKRQAAIKVLLNAEGANKKNIYTKALKNLEAQAALGVNNETNPNNNFDLGLNLKALENQWKTAKGNKKEEIQKVLNALKETNTNNVKKVAYRKALKNLAAQEALGVNNETNNNLQALRKRFAFITNTNNLAGINIKAALGLPENTNIKTLNALRKTLENRKFAPGAIKPVVGNGNATNNLTTLAEKWEKANKTINTNRAIQKALNAVILKINSNNNAKKNAYKLALEALKAKVAPSNEPMVTSLNKAALNPSRESSIPTNNNTSNLTKMLANFQNRRTLIANKPEYKNIFTQLNKNMGKTNINNKSRIEAYKKAFNKINANLKALENQWAAAIGKRTNKTVQERAIAQALVANGANPVEVYKNFINKLSKNVKPSM